MFDPVSAVPRQFCHGEMTRMVEKELSEKDFIPTLHSLQLGNYSVI